jgi:hypothetical protein
MTEKAVPTALVLCFQNVAITIVLRKCGVAAGSDSSIQKCVMDTIRFK